MATQAHGLTRILLVDADPAVRARFAVAAADSGARLRLAANAEEAWRLFKAEPPDVVFAEYALPAIDGLRFLDQVGAWYPATLRILHTGAKLRAPSFGLDIPVLGKPCDEATLRALLADLRPLPRRA